jgi:hypothetical protein
MLSQLRIALMVLTLASANLTPVTAESGSGGGSIGNDDKAVSGVRKANPSTPQPKQRATGTAPTGPCSKLAGTWSWYMRTTNVIFQKDGTAEHPASGTAGKWTCAGNTGSIVWNTGGGATRTDHMTLAQDGESILFVSPWGGGIQFTSTRR